jgi:uncharacterized protein
MITRRALATLNAALARRPAVALLGPRQVGKTTLALEIAKTTPSLYLDLENPSHLKQLTDAELFFTGQRDKLIILDEIQRHPALFQVLRGLIDQARQTGRTHGQFLLLGSASMDLLRQSSESLAGRITHLELGQIDALEIAGTRPDLDRLWLRGGFPDSLLAADDADSFAWRQDFIRTYLERDIPAFAPKIPTETLRRFWTMLAHQQGSLLNTSQLASSLEMSSPALTRYTNLMVDLLLLRRLRPYHVNIGKRLVKSPKVYVRDSGITHALLGIVTMETVLGHPVAGSSWEGMVLESLIQTLPAWVLPSFYRTAAGAEVDLILEFPGNRVWAIEIKRSLSPKVSKGFYQACQDLTPEKAFVVYAGQDRYPLAPGLEVIGLRQLATELLAIQPP